MALALNCDWRVSSTGCMFCHGNLPRNMNPITHFSASFPQAVGASGASGLYLCDSTVEAKQAFSLGLVDAISPSLTSAVQCVVGMSSFQCLMAKPDAICCPQKRIALMLLEDLSNALTLRVRGVILPEMSEHVLGEVEQTSFVCYITSSDQAEQAMHEMVAEKVRALTSSAHPVGAERPLLEHLDSLGSTELLTSIQSELGQACRLPSVLVFDFPSITAISGYILNLLQCVSCVKEDRMRTARQDTNSLPSIMHGQGRFPCLLLKNLYNASDNLSDVPQYRLNTIEMGNQGVYVKQGHFITDPDTFDNIMFSVSCSEAMSVDPHQRHLLEIAYSTAIASGFNMSSLKGSDIAVILGMSSDGEWSDFPSPKSPYAVTGVTSAMAAGRLSYVFGMQGANLSVNTTCSSSLVSMHLAHHIGSKADSRTLVLGANMYLSSWGWIACCAMHALSPDGQCKTFDSSADGFGRGEGFGAVILETGQSSDSQKSCRVWLQSIGVNHDGRAAAIAAPNGLAQARLLENTGSLSNTQFSDTHGTGTSLGDPIEVNALNVVLESRDATTDSMNLGALKSNIGHSEGAAGMAALLRATAALTKGCSSPNFHLCCTNSKLDFQPSTSMPSQNMPQAHEKFHGVSSFGMSGTNAHAVVSAAMWCELPLCIRAPTSRFKATRFAWWDANTANASALLGAAQIDAGGRAWWEHTWTRTTCSYLAHHRIGSAPVAPGTAFLWIAHTAAAGEHTPKTQISSSQFEAMLFLDSDGLGPTLTVICQSGTVTIDSRDAAGVRISHALIALSEASTCSNAISKQSECQNPFIAAFMIAREVCLHLSGLFCLQSKQQAIALCDTNWFQIPYSSMISSTMKSSRVIFLAEQLCSHRTRRSMYSVAWIQHNEFITSVDCSQSIAFTVTDRSSAFNEVLKQESDTWVVATVLEAVYLSLRHHSVGNRRVAVDHSYGTDSCFIVISNLLLLLQSVDQSVANMYSLWIFCSFNPGNEELSINTAISGITRAMPKETDRCICATITGHSTIVNLIEAARIVRTYPPVKVAPELKVFGGKLYSSRIQTCSHDCSLLHDTTSSRNEQSMLTGGTGALGILIAMWFASHGSVHLQLLSRSCAPAHQANESWKSLRLAAVGCHMTISQCNVRDMGVISHAHVLGDMGVTAQKCALSSHLVHCSGTLEDAMLCHQKQAGLRYVWGSKSCPAWILHSVSNSIHFGSFTLFSSVSSLWGVAGQYNYASANSYLDSICQLRYSCGLAGVSLQWGAWMGAGMAVQSAVVGPASSSSSVGITVPIGFCAFEIAIRSHNLPVVAMWATQVSSRVSLSNHGCSQHVATPCVVRSEPLINEILSEIGKGPVDKDEPLMETALDSLAAIELRNRLSTGLGLEQTLGIGILFDYPTVASLIVYLDSLLRGAEGGMDVDEVPDPGCQITVLLAPL